MYDDELVLPTHSILKLLSLLIFLIMFDYSFYSKY
jgi:hypothetical protein